MHQKIAQEIIGVLHSIFPNDSIALTGSVANGSYNCNSDIDLLFASNDIDKSYSIKFFYQNIEISLFVFHKRLFYQNKINFLYNYHNMPILFILNSREAYDSNKIIFDFKNKIEDVFDKRRILKISLIEELKNDIHMLFRFTPNDIIEKKRLLYTICEKIISIFFLMKQNKGTKSKLEGYDPFSVIKKEDFKLYSAFKEGLPFHERSYMIIKEAFYNYILINY